MMASPLNFIRKLRTRSFPSLWRLWIWPLKRNACLNHSTAIITVIHKKNKGPLTCSSYQPVSLLNSDYKIISKAMAIRLGQYLPALINTDQTGFVLKRSSTNNLHRLFNVIHMANTSTDPSIAVSLDAEKAFDRLERPYLFQVLSRFNFGTWFINWVETLYFKPQAKISYNGIT